MAAGYQTNDFTHNVCEIVNVYVATVRDKNLCATIYYKPNREFEVQGGCVVSEHTETEYNWAKVRYDVLAQKFKIVTSSGSVFDVQRRKGGVYRVTTPGYQITKEVVRV